MCQGSHSHLWHFDVIPGIIPELLRVTSQGKEKQVHFFFYIHDLHILQDGSEMLLSVQCIYLHHNFFLGSGCPSLCWNAIRKREELQPLYLLNKTLQLHIKKSNKKPIKKPTKKHYTSSWLLWTHVCNSQRDSELLMKTKIPMYGTVF